jgi:hypothetical protein
VLQQVRPDLVLLNEFDFDDAHRAADLFQKRYLEVAQPGGGKPLHFAYRYLAPVNTGVPSGLDLDNNGVVGGEGRSRGNDAWGYGLHPGQYGMLVLSRYPIDEAKVRSFQLLKWSAMPGAIRPVDPRTGKSFYNDHVWSQLRLSSKSHWDVPVKTPAAWCTRWSRTRRRRCSTARKSATPRATTTNCACGRNTCPRVTSRGCATTRASAVAWRRTRAS